LQDVDDTAFVQNVRLIGKMLNHHDEFQEAMNRKIKIVAAGEKITTAAMNPVMQEKVTEVIRQIDEQNSKSFNFGANMRLLNMKKMENWVKSRRQGLQQIETMNKAEIAEEIFKVWDRKLRRYIIFEDLAEHLITLGVAPDQHTVRKIMLALKGEDANFPD